MQLNAVLYCVCWHACPSAQQLVRGLLPSARCAAHFSASGPPPMPIHACSPRSFDPNYADDDMEEDEEAEDMDAEDGEE